MTPSSGGPLCLPIACWFEPAAPCVKDRGLIGMQQAQHGSETCPPTSSPFAQALKGYTANWTSGGRLDLGQEILVEALPVLCGGLRVDLVEAADCRLLEPMGCYLLRCPAL
eukprot:CAMPEP_0183592588 /NCGR_PEP_ID=MMETSP0371-20130417/168242_1 /TAXON_ID=268820 /ORGANISM="Peridinium aciculiferum, Strain PAER-2" /LENGTH=110 /DNA_ID=CAMNT_0025804131 /DNA_START=346 /DNA_END=678 /DNA_ORIENTATION=-